MKCTGKKGVVSLLAWPSLLARVLIRMQGPRRRPNTDAIALLVLLALSACHSGSTHEEAFPVQMRGRTPITRVIASPDGPEIVGLDEADVLVVRADDLDWAQERLAAEGFRILEWWYEPMEFYFFGEDVRGVFFEAIFLRNGVASVLSCGAELVPVASNAFWSSGLNPSWGRSNDYMAMFVPSEIEEARAIAHELASRYPGIVIIK